MKILAWDTETALIAARTQVAPNSGRAVVNTGPFVTPDIVLGSIAGEGFEDGRVVNPALLAAQLEDWLEGGPDHHLVGHNLPFDYAVVCKFAPHMREVFDKAAEEGRLHDTMLLDVLYGLSVGRYDRPKFNPETKVWSREEVKSRRLADLAFSYLGQHLAKDDHIRLGFGQFKGRPIAELPEEFRFYAAQDAVATYKVFLELKARLEKDGRRNWLSEPIQVRAALALRPLDERGVVVDWALAAKLQRQVESWLDPLRHELVAGGLGRWEKDMAVGEPKIEPPCPRTGPTAWTWDPKSKLVFKYRHFKKMSKLSWAKGVFSLNTAEIQEALRPFADKETPLRANQAISLEYDYWAEHLPAEAPPILRRWLEHEKGKKILTTYLSLYSRTPEVFPRWHIIGARSGRMSASSPNLQNIPKRKYGIRALFLPRVGKVFVKGDYSAQEMLTLAEILEVKHLGQGPLYAMISSGVDLHRFAASMMFGKPAAEVTKEERQALKALNFGVPGGLGARKLRDYAAQTWGLDWTVATAAYHRQKYLEVFTDVAAYLEDLKVSQDALLRRLTGEGRRGWAETLELTDWNVIKAMQRHPDPEIQEIGQLAEQSQVVELPTGRVRAQCRFTEAANCGFQGLASDVTKEAVWRCYRAGLVVVMVVHDEIVVESAPSEAGGAGRVLEESMLAAFRAVCPSVGQFAKVEVEGPLTRWGPATDPNGKEVDLSSI